MREWPLYMYCLRHNVQAAAAVVVSYMGLMGIFLGLVWADDVILWASGFLTLTGFVGMIWTGAGADTFGQYLITRQTITSAEVRPSHINISIRLPRAERIGAELACYSFGISHN